MSEKKTQTFEEAYERLEAILEKMNHEQVSLDEALALYEEADTLIGSCQKRLSEAEQKIEILLKNRDSQLLLDKEGSVQTDDYRPPNHSSLSETHG